MPKVDPKTIDDDGDDPFEMDDAEDNYPWGWDDEENLVHQKAQPLKVGFLEGIRMSVKTPKETEKR